MNTRQKLAELLNCRITVTEIEPKEFLGKLGYTEEESQRESSNMQSLAQLAEEIRKGRR